MKDLKDVIRIIDNSKNRKKELEKALENNLELRKFCDDILILLGYMNEQGEFLFQFNFILF